MMPEERPTLPRKDAEPLVRVTEAAAKKIKQFAASVDDYKGKIFRVYIEGGGCSGFQYGFTFDEAREEDSRIPAGAVEVLVDPQSAMYLKGSTVDFAEDLRGAGFVVKNPNASGTCGCGHSFSV
ncbi:MAG: iron-sulfur cluster insertion protein ErpA [Acidobacteriota bacterium]